MVGDSLPADIAGARGLGMRAVLVSRSGPSGHVAPVPGGRAGHPVAARAAGHCSDADSVRSRRSRSAARSRARENRLGLHRRRRRRPAAGPDRLDQARRHPARRVRRRRRDARVRLLDAGDQGRPADAVVAHAGRDAGDARCRARRAAEAGAAPGRARHGPRPHRVDLRSAAGRQRSPQLRQARRRRRGVRREHLRRVEQPAAPRHADGSLRRRVAASRAARRAPNRGARRPVGTRQLGRWRASRQPVAAMGAVAAAGAGRPVD